MKQYGVSGSTTVGRRGADATQTQVVWNGLPVNNPMLGMSDFYNQNIWSMDRVELVEGGSSTLVGSGSVGGTLYLNQNPRFYSGSNLQAFSEMGQFGRNNQMIRSQMGRARWYSSTTLSRRVNTNQFEFFDPIWMTERVMDHARNSQLGWNQHLALQSKTPGQWQMSLKAEHLQSKRNLGQQWGRESSLGTQQDQIFRWSFETQSKTPWGLFLMRLGQTSNAIQFEDGYTSLVQWDSSQSRAEHLQLEYHWSHESWELMAGQDGLRVWAQTPFYHQERGYWASFMALNRSTKQWKISFQSRLEWVERLPTFSFSGERQVHLTTWKFNVHSSFRRPTFNDLYWNSGLIPDLSPEKGYGAEFSGMKNFEKAKIQLEGTVYARELDNPIVWLPSSTAFWQAQNLYRSQFIGFQMHSLWEKGKIRWTNRWDAVRSWVWMEATQNSALQQLFVPNWNGTSAMEFRHKDWQVLLRANYTGARYIQTDNQASLPSYTLWELRGNYQIPHTNWLLGLGSENLSNASYQNMPGRPMAPRLLFFSIHYNSQLSL
jgi:iron complex outermembrane receptor protein